MEAMGSEVMQSSTTSKNENATNCLHDDVIELDEPINVVGCVQKKVHQFYFIKYWPYEGQTLKSRIEDAEKLYKRITSEAWSMADKFTERLVDQRTAIVELIRLRSGHTTYTLEWTINTLDQLQEALEKWNSAKSAYLRRAIKSCSSGELVNSMLHRTYNMATEKKILREINKSRRKGAVDSFSPVVDFGLLFQSSLCEVKLLNNNEVNDKILNTIQQLGKILENAIANATQKGRIWNPLVTKNSIQGHIRHMNKLTEELRKKHLQVKDKIKSLEKYLEIAENDGRQFRKEFNDIKQRRDEINRHIHSLRRQQDEEKGRYCRYASILGNARELARNKNVKALQELSLREVDIFMSQWNKSKAFRYNYERSILTSLDTRQLSRDGRMSNLNWQPPLS